MWEKNTSPALLQSTVLFHYFAAMPPISVSLSSSTFLTKYGQIWLLKGQEDQGQNLKKGSSQYDFWPHGGYIYFSVSNYIFCC